MTQDQPVPAKRFSIHDIAAEVRDGVLSGKYPPGSRLPSTGDFAESFSSGYSTVHLALKAIEKEGWIERRHGHGTYVAQPEKRFLHAGIYFSDQIAADDDAIFYRSLTDCLTRKLRRLGKTVQIITDSRPQELQRDVFPPLAEAIFNRKIQCLISPTLNTDNYRSLVNLSIPTAFLASYLNESLVDFDEFSFGRGSLRSLARQGCRSIGFITNKPADRWNFDMFLEECRSSGLETRREWLIQPDLHPIDVGHYGYEQFKKMWHLPGRPDGLIVYPDVAVRGAIIAALEVGAHLTDAMKFVFHRNIRTPMLCPFPVTWAISNEEDVADALLGSIQDQFAGLKPQRVKVPFTFEAGTTVRVPVRPGS